MPPRRPELPKVFHHARFDEFASCKMPHGDLREFQPSKLCNIFVLPETGSGAVVGLMVYRLVIVDSKNDENMRSAGHADSNLPNATQRADLADHPQAAARGEMPVATTHPTVGPLVMVTHAKHVDQLLLPVPA